MRKESNPVQTSFEYSGCALQAVAFLFKLDKPSVELLAKVLKIRKLENGLTTFQIRKLINLIALSQMKRITYEPNHNKISFYEFLHTHPKGRFLINQDYHLSCVINKVVFDNWDPTSYETLGWWRVESKLKKEERGISNEMLIETYYDLAP